MTDHAELRAHLESRTSEELADLVRTHDEDEWRPEVFDIARAILHERGVEVTPPAPEATPTAAVPEDLVPIAAFSSVADSEQCRAALVSAGFEVFLLDENAVGVDPALWPALGGVKIAVSTDDEDEAREFLAAVDRGDLATAPEVAIACDACGSTNVKYVGRSDRASAVLNTVFTGLVTASRDGEWVCPDCGSKQR
jgi:hypothetical protein